MQNEQGDYYESHDIGNVLLMLPAAATASTLSDGPTQEQIESPPILVKFGVAMTYATLSAIGCFFVFMLFSLFYPLISFSLSFAFATTTFFWPYAKSSWDVMGGCVGVCMLLYFAAKILHEEQVQNKTVLFAGGALALAGSFRVSLAPFLVLGFLALLYFARSKVRWRHVVIFLVVVFVGMIPSFIYNFVRMGSPLRPATTASQYDVVNVSMP